MGRCIEIDNFQFVVFVHSRVRGGNAPPSMTKSEPFFNKKGSDFLYIISFVISCIHPSERECFPRSACICSICSKSDTLRSATRTLISSNGKF